MSTPKHTAGPWEIVYRGMGNVTAHIGPAADRSIKTDIAALPANTPEQIANAHLIVAAPDLLAALETAEVGLHTAAVQADLRSDKDAADAYLSAAAICRAAINKAKGGV